MARGPDKQFDTEVALDRAMRLFWAKGYAATGLSELLETMGIARKSLYDTFGSKRQLFLSALQRYADQELGRIEGNLRHAGSPLENVRRVLRSWQSASSQPDSCGCMLGNNTAHLDIDDDAMRLLSDYFSRLEAAFAEALTKARDAGELRSATSPRDLARLLVAAAQGLALISRTRDDSTLARSVTRAALAALDAA